MYKVRFHLGRGKNFMKWQVSSNLNTGDGTGARHVVSYINPSENQLALFDCKLAIQPSAAKKIHEGACKTVCAWIQCAEVQVLSPNRIIKNDTDWNVRFNPRVSPEWYGEDGRVVSGEQFPIIFTNDRSLFVMGNAFECEDYDNVIRPYLLNEQEQ
jgi:hypothetical protein